MSKKMYNFGTRQNRLSDVLPYTLPQLHTGKSWYVDFKCFDPVSGTMRRKKYQLDRYKKISERRSRASEIIYTVTSRLRSGWNVWVKVESTREHTPFSECLELYKAYLGRSAENGAMKPKTAYGYLSYLGIFTEWLSSRIVPVKFCYQIDQFLVSDFLDYVLIDREGSARTRNNYLTWLSTLCSWMVEKGYLKESPTEKIKKLREEPKKREALSSGELASLQDYLGKTNKHYLLACLMEYYTFIRPIELSQIKLENINIAEQKVFVPASVSKNRKDGMVGLNDGIIKLMAELRVFDRPSHCYLFGKDFKPSEQRADSRVFRDYFVKVREALRWDDSKQFYSLKDSGIRDLANAEGIVVARDQARHSDISTTNKYLKGDSLTVHEQTKHFRGALAAEVEQSIPSKDNEGLQHPKEPANQPFKEKNKPKPAPQKSEPKKPEVTTEARDERKTPHVVKEEASGRERKRSGVPAEACAPAHKATTLPTSDCKDSHAPSMAVPQAPDLHPVPPMKEESPKEESPANKARDFNALLAGKGAVKRKRQRIPKGISVYSTSKK